MRNFMGIYDDVRTRLEAEVQKAGGQSTIHRLTGVKQPTLSKFFKGEHSIRFDLVCKLLENFGAQISWPEDRREQSRDIKWIEAKIVPAGRGQPLPEADSYFAVPLVGEVGAGPGVMPDEEIKSWVLVYRHQRAVKFKTNLLAVEIDNRSTSMVPLLRPGDIILVDRDTFRPERDGQIFLVREPGQEGGAMVKRVATKTVNGDTILTFYSDNSAANPPTTHSLTGDYGGELGNAIVGRCIWAWSDISDK